MVIWLLLSCSDAPKTEQAAEVMEQAAPLEPMDSTRLVTRLSLDLRGTRPSVDELERLDAGTASIDDLTEEFLYHQRFGPRVRNIFAEIYNTETDVFTVGADSFGIAEEPQFIQSVGQEPLRLIQEVAENDLPWTDIVTANWTMANEYLGSAFQMDYPADETGWQRSTYTDGRPMSGILSTNGMWWRYTSTASNANRRRANALSRILLCNDYLSKPIEFTRDLDLFDEDAIQNAIQNDPACINCHNSLDPLAAHLFGFWAPQVDSWLAISRYHPERELLYEQYLDTAPAYYGMESNNLTDLGHSIAGDSRFPSCATEQIMRALFQRDIETVDVNATVVHREAFITGDLTLRALIRSVVQDPNYRPPAHADDLQLADSKLLSADQLASAIDDLTGYQWNYAGYDMLKNDLIGLRTLAGGTDGSTVIQNARQPNATLVLVQARLAELASFYAIDNENQQPLEERKLFPYIEFTQHIDDDLGQSVDQLQHLHRLVLSQRVDSDGPEIEANLELWKAIYRSGEDTKTAWAAVLIALLRDPDFLLY